MTSRAEARGLWSTSPKILATYHKDFLDRISSDTREIIVGAMVRKDG